MGQTRPLQGTSLSQEAQKDGNARNHKEVSTKHIWQRLTVASSASFKASVSLMPWSLHSFPA